MLAYSLDSMPVSFCDCKANSAIKLITEFGPGSFLFRENICVDFSANRSAVFQGDECSAEGESESASECAEHGGNAASGEFWSR